MATRTRINKKSQMEHFNWIFVLVAGTIILIFFITIVQKQKFIAQTKLAASIRTDISVILTGAGVVPDTTNILTMPKTAISFTCDQEGYSDFAIAKTGVNKQTSFDVIFAPDLVKGPTLITWTKEFKLPFTVMNFLYLTDAQIRYIFVFNPDNQFAQQILEDFPEEVNKEVVTSATRMVDKNNYKVKFIFFGTVDTSAADAFRNMPDKDVTAINIIALDNKIKFYKKDKDQGFVLEGTTPYLRDTENAFIYGSIFSEDKIFYECNLRKALKRLVTIANLLAERESELVQKTDLMKGTCNSSSYWKWKEEDKFLVAKLAEIIESCSEDLDCDNAKINLIAFGQWGIEDNNYKLSDKTCSYIY